MNRPGERIDTLLHRVRCPSRGDPIVNRLRLGSALARADWSVPGLPPSAILCARRLRLRVAGRGWTERLTGELARLGASAAWPARGFVGASAEAVAFADESEWLFCLARDTLRGDRAAHWWWDAHRARGWETAGDRDPAPWLVASPTVAPSAIERLARAGLLSALARALSDDSANQVASAVASAFGLATLPRVRSLDALAPEPDWAPLVAEARSASNEAGRLVPLVLSLALARRPILASRAGFAAEAVALAVRLASAVPVDDRAAVPSGRVEGATSLSTSGPSPTPSSPVRSLGVEPASEVAANVGLPSLSVPRFDPGPRPEEKAGDPSGRTAPVSSRKPEPVPSGSPVVPETGPEPTARGPLPPRSATAPQPRSTPEPDPGHAGEPGADALAVEAVQAFRTGFGGLFYLVNVALSLGLYGDFTRPMDLGIALPLWDFLAWFGLRWLGPELDGDPLGPWLARCSGRTVEERPGWNVPAPEGWEPPEDWRPFVSALPACESPCPSVSAWLGWLAAAVEARLIVSLGLDGPHAIVPMLVRHGATVHASPTRLDVLFALDRLPVAVRLSGLDRDPGWVPAAGRAVRFHFN